MEGLMLRIAVVYGSKGGDESKAGEDEQSVDGQSKCIKKCVDLAVLNNRKHQFYNSATASFYNVLMIYKL